MNPNVLTTVITAGSSVLIAVVALTLNHRVPDSVDKRFDSMDWRFASIERRLEVIEADLKRFYELLGGLSTDVARLKDHTGLK